MDATDRNFSMVEYFNRKVAAFEPKYRFKGSSKQEFESWKRRLLAELDKLLGPMPQPVPLNPEIVWELKVDGLIKQRVLLDLEEHASAAALVCIPDSALSSPAPAILCNHGHGPFGKDSVMGVTNSYEPQRETEIKAHNYDYGLQMARRGYVTMAIDWRAFGERSEGENAYEGRDKCNINFIKGSLLGMNLLTLDVFDAKRALDYLCELPCVDSARVGAMGLSFGGTMTTWLAILDDRIKAADIICYSARFKDFAIARSNFCGSQILPGLFALCDMPDLHGLIAPKPLLAEVGVHDVCFKQNEALDCCREVENIYKAAGVPQNYETDIFEGGHRFAGNKAFDFFARHLKNGTA